MALADIQKKSAEERKREKRLVHLTNTLSRDYLDSGVLKKATKSQREAASYLIKSMLDYVFFEERKEIQELQNRQVHDFMLVYAPYKLNLSDDAGKAAPETLTSFLHFLDENGHIKNGDQLCEEVEVNKQAFLKLMPKPKKKQTSKKTAAGKSIRSKTSAKQETEIKVGRNDPCPCGSGKKYKKCCGQQK